MVPGLLELRPITFAQAGPLVLEAAPVLRVAASTMAFERKGDRLYAAITIAVLTILLVSLFCAASQIPDPGLRSIRATLHWPRRDQMLAAGPPGTSRPLGCCLARGGASS